MANGHAGPWRSAKGFHYEHHALTWLRARGLMLVERNYRCPLGEIDLVMRDGPVLVFIEVRFRAGTGHGAASETVDHRKQRKLLRTAQHFLLRRRQFQNCPCRFDILGIGAAGQDLQIEWLRNAFQ